MDASDLTNEAPVPPSAEAPRTFNLFIYGSLRDAQIFQSVCGFGFTLNPSKVDTHRLLAEPAFLSDHRRVTPDNVYYYAVKSETSRIEGLVVHRIPDSAMKQIDWYEGKRYKRETVIVNTASGPVEAQSYLASVETMTRHFGDRFHVNLIHELWLRKRIEKFIRKHTRPGESTVDAELERRAERMLLATTERDLVMSHYHNDAVSDYYLEHELQRPRPSIRHLYDDPEARPYIENYLAMVVRQVLLNELDEQVVSHFRFEIERILPSERYFKRSISLLAALLIINSNRSNVRLIVEKCLSTMPYEKHDLIDYVKYAIQAAGSLFDPRVARASLERIQSHLQPGLIPLGAEIELSNLGRAAVEPQRSAMKAFDPVYCGFKYFHDFCMDVLAWKTGGYIDDHSGSTDLARRSGFLEFAPGRLNIAGELSRPATADPWLLNQLIHETTKFYAVRPHSLHLSFQMFKRQVGHQEVLPLPFVKCLLVLGGGPEERYGGRLWVSRMGYDEIQQYDYGEELAFARTSRRKWFLGNDEFGDRPPLQAITSVQQYKFIRLELRANYEPLILCLKGLQVAFNPGDYLTAEQLRSSKHRKEYRELKNWASDPTPIAPQTITRFLKVVKEGLMNERHNRPAHKLHYIEWALSAVDIQLRMFNQRLANTSLR